MSFGSTPTQGRRSSRAVIGRDAELRALEAALDAVDAGGAQVIVISGAPGIGKTHLLRILERRAADRGHVVAMGRAAEYEQEMPFGAWMDALDELLTDLARPVAERLGPARVDELMRLTRQSAPDAARGAPALAVERYLLHDAGRRLLEVAAGSDPLTLILDDVHWADPASIELLVSLLRQPPRAPVLLAFAHRARRAAPRMLAAIAEARTHGVLTSLELTPLNADEAFELVGSRIPESERDRLYAASGGVPFYLTELARAGAVADGPVGGDGRDDEVPARVMTAIRSELDRLAPGTRTVAQAAALLGDPVRRDLVGLVAGAPAWATLGALDQLVAIDLLDPDDVIGSYRFRHPIVRQAVYESTSETFRLGAHARAAAALTARGAPLAVRARHVERSARPGDREAIALLSEAGHAAVGRAPATAARWFEAALRLTGPDDLDRRLELLLPLAAARAAIGQLEGCRAVLAETLELLPPEQSVVRARVIGLAAGIEQMRGDADGAAALVENGLAHVGPDDRAGACALRIETAIVRWFAVEWDVMVHEANTAVEEARAVGDPALELDAVALCSLGEYYLAHADRSDAALARAAVILEDLDDHQLAASVRSLLFLGLAGIGMERFRETAQYLHRGIAIARSTGQEFWLLGLATALAVNELWLGRLVEARERARSAIEASSLTGNDQTFMWTHAAHAWSCLLMGDVDAALASAEASRDALTRAPSAVLGWLPACIHGEVLLASGDPERAIAVMVGQAGGRGLERIEPGFRIHWWEVLSRAELARGRPGAAGEWLDRGERLAMSFQLPGRQAELDRGRADVLLATGHPGRALVLAERAMSEFEELDQPVDAGRAALLAARALAEIGRTPEARQVLAGARTTLAACGARGFAATADELLSRLDAPVPSATGMASLSVREREVAEHVARGLTNRDIARELGLSDRTVERHLSRIFAKLHITSRAALAALVAREQPAA